MKPHLDAITDAQREVLQRLAPFAGARHLYLGGGTAIALHLGHRRSVDLDWFSDEPIRDPMQLAQDLQGAGAELQVTSTARGTLHGTIAGVRVSFLEFGYPLLEQLDSIADCACPIAEKIDLAAMKLLAVTQRGAKKDFVDVYALGLKGLRLGDMLEAFVRKFSVSDSARVLYGLSYFDDAEPEPMPQMLWDTDWDSMKRSIRQWIRDVMSQKDAGGS